MENLTMREIEFLKNLKKMHNPDDCYSDDKTIVFSIQCICDALSLNPKIIRGVVTSLVKKRIILDQFIENNEQHFSYDI